jgi:hypothetical protein
MIDLDDIQRVADLAKSYLAERKRFERMSDRARQAGTPKQAQKTSTDLNWQAMGLSKIEAALHAACVDAGLADLREASAYAQREFRPSGWHVYPFTPPRPRSFEEVA